MKTFNKGVKIYERLKKINSSIDFSSDFIIAYQVRMRKILMQH